MTPGATNPGDISHTKRENEGIMTITRPKVKRCGPSCYCPACNAEWADYWSEQREIDELVHRARLVREHMPATDDEWRDYLSMWAEGVGCG
jgi:hypothetical protein